MFEWSVKRRTGQLVLDLCFSASAMVQEFFGYDERCRLTLEQLVSLRWQGFGYRNASVARAELMLATAILLNRDCSRKDTRKAYSLSTEASLHFASSDSPMQHARCEYQRGIAQTRLGNESYALVHFELAEKIFEDVFPISRERTFNLQRLAVALEGQGRKVEAEKARNLAHGLDAILIRMAMRPHYY